MFKTLVDILRLRSRRARAIADSPTAELAATMLTAPTALSDLTPDEAREVVSYMAPMRFTAGTTFIKEGDTEHTDFMLLVLDGEVTVETIVVSRVSPITVTVLGPGSMLGEMGMLDGEPRSASCTATSDLLCAILKRDALEELIARSPRLGVKLLTAVCIRVGQRLRDNNDKLKLYVRLTKTMQAEIDRLLPS